MTAYLQEGIQLWVHYRANIICIVTINEVYTKRNERRTLLIWSQVAAGYCGLCNAGCTNMVPQAPIESEIHTLWDCMSVPLHIRIAAPKICVSSSKNFFCFITSCEAQFFHQGSPKCNQNALLSSFSSCIKKN